MICILVICIVFRELSLRFLILGRLAIIEAPFGHVLLFFHFHHDIELAHLRRTFWKLS